MSQKVFYGMMIQCFINAALAATHVIELSIGQQVVTGLLSFIVTRFTKD